MCYNLFCQFGQGLIWITDFCHDLNTSWIPEGKLIWVEFIGVN